MLFAFCLPVSGIVVLVSAPYAAVLLFIDYDLP